MRWGEEAGDDVGNIVHSTSIYQYVWYPMSASPQSPKSQGREQIINPVSDPQSGLLTPRLLEG